jgi:RNA polymerase sigma-70 factor (sigma-E family)
VTSAEEFIEFATAASPRLRRTAFLLCGNWHTAEDLAQTTLAKMFVSWRRVSQPEAAHAYATRTLVNCYLAGRRRKRATELLLSRPPDRAVEPQAPELRLLVLDALATLPPRARAVVVLRYWEDLSVEQVAQLLGCSPGNVKSQSARSLDKLRAVLTEAAPGHCPLGQPSAPPPRTQPYEAQPHEGRPHEGRPAEGWPAEARDARHG